MEITRIKTVNIDRHDPVNEFVTGQQWIAGISQTGPSNAACMSIDPLQYWFDKTGHESPACAGEEQRLLRIVGLVILPAF